MTHPYSDLPRRAFWKKFVSDTAWRELPFNDQPKFQLARDARLATAGSCFAQHISRYMRNAGMAPYIAEPAHVLQQQYGGEVDSYTQFSARYGNIYSSRQCLELFRQAFGLMPMVEDFVEEGGRWFDLLRPNAIKQGFATLSEARADRAWHLGRVRLMFETTDVFVFTLGLTESWFNTRHGHTYPACPGTVKGEYRPDEHGFRNLACTEVVADLQALIHGLAEVNPALKLILTVSPVPLVATRSGHNVLVASSYSKAVLRAAVGEVEQQHDHVAYFPSYEIISHAGSFGQYLAADLREVTERGVSHVMGCFMSTFFSDALNEATATTLVAQPLPRPYMVPVQTVQPTTMGRALAAPLAGMPPPAECDELFNSVGA